MESNIKKTLCYIKNNKTVFIFIFAFPFYILLIKDVITLPPIGVHAWNEAIYLTFLHQLVNYSSDPFIFIQAYDPSRVDFNVGYLYFWVIFIFYKLFSNIFLTNEFILLRIPSIVFTFISVILLYKLLTYFSKDRFSIILITLFFLFSPLVIYFGCKVQLEPFVFMLFLVTQILILHAIITKKLKYLFVSSFLLGGLIATRQNFIVFVPIYLILPVYIEAVQQFKNGRKRKVNMGLNPKRSKIFCAKSNCETASIDKKILFNIKNISCSTLSILLGIGFTIIPSQILHSTYNPMKFLFLRIFESHSYALEPGKNLTNIFLTFLSDCLWNNINILFILFMLSLLLPIVKKTNPNLMDTKKIYFLSLTLLSLIFLGYTYPHDANHVYQLYYGLLPMLIGSTILLTELRKKIMPTTLKTFLFMIFIIFFVYASSSSLQSYYGSFDERIWNGSIDPYGTIESYAVGQVISQLDLPSDMYILVQSPTVYYPSHHRAITYYELYRWDESAKEYNKYNFFDNQTAFISEMKKLPIALLTITPDVSSVASEDFGSYIHKNFEVITTTKHFTICVNKTLLNTSTNIKSSIVKGFLTYYNNEIYWESIAGEKLINLVSDAADIMSTDKTILYILDVEPDLYHFHDEEGIASSSIEIINNGTYRLAIRAKGDFKVQIGDKKFGFHNSNLTYWYSPIFELNEGKYNLTITPLDTPIANFSFESVSPNINIENGIIKKLPEGVVSFSNDSYSGNSSLKITTNVSEKGWLWFRTIDVNVMPGERYSAITHMKYENVVASYISIEGYNETSGEWIELGEIPSGQTGTSDWKEYKQILTIPEDNTKIGFVLNAGWIKDPDEGNATTWLDDIRIYSAKDYLDVMWLYSTRNNETLNELFKTNETPAEVINYTKINPTKYEVEVNASKPFMLSFAEAYDPLWEARIYKDGAKVEVVKSIPLYSVINGFWVEETGDLEIEIRYKPQEWFVLGLWISGITFFGCLSYLFYDWRRGEGDKWALRIGARVHNAGSVVSRRFGEGVQRLKKKPRREK